jgi:hypothetical protein
MGVARKRGDNGIGISLNALISLGVVTLIVAILFTAGNMMPTGKVVDAPPVNVAVADAPPAQLEPTPPAQNEQPSGFETSGYETAASDCGSFGGDTILTQDVSSMTTCITITGDNLVFDCNGFTITYCTSCGGSASGIFANYRNNVTIKNCKITTSGAGTDLAGIRLTGTNGSLINSTTITHLFSSGSKGISFESSAFYNTVANSRINVTCSGSSPCYGIMAMFGPYNNITGTSIILNTTVQNSAGIDANAMSPGLNISYTNVSVNANLINLCTGISLRAENQSISSTNVTVNGNMYITGLNLSQANNSVVSASSFNSFSSMANRGVAADSSYNLRFSSNNIKVNGTTDVQGLMLTSSGGTFRLTNITQTDGYGTGILMQNSAGTSFNSTILNNTLTWVIAYGSSQNNNFTNTTFMNANGSINILGSFNYSVLSLDNSFLIVAHYRAFLNSSNLTFLNQTAIVYFAQTGITIPVPLVDWNDDGIYEQCPGDVCSVLNNTISSATINVSHFTSYSLAEANISSCPATIITSASLANNVSSSGTCITVNASNVELDCRGHIITYDSGGGTNSYGVYANRKTNVTVKNCIIFDPTTAGTNGFSVYFNGTNNSLVTNSTMAANGSVNNYPVYLYSSSGNTVQNSILKPRSINGEVGLVIEQSTYQNITNNAITTFNIGSANIGVEITGSSRCAFVNNSVTTYGDSANHGIMLSSSSNITIENSTVTTSGTDGTKCIMLQSASRDNSITGSRITALTADSVSEGIYISNSHHTILSYNNISTMPLSYGIELLYANFTSAYNTWFNTSGQWINTTLSYNNNFTNTTFVTASGSINLPYNFTVSGNYDINRIKLNVTTNRARLNSSALPFMNTSGIITLYGISYLQPKPTVNYSDGGTYADCPADTCTNLSYSGNTFVYNVTHFTGYSSAENFTAITGCPVTINESTTLGQDIASNTTCILINANSVTLDCRGHTISYGHYGSGFGVWTQYKRGLIIKDCVLVLTNTSASGTYAIYLAGSNHSLVQNNTMLINGTDANEGINLFKSWNDSLLNNRILVNSSGASNLGIFVGAGAGNNTIEGNIIVTNGSTDSDGIVSYSPGGHRINYNNITTHGDISFGVLFVFGGQNSSVTGNRIETDGLSSYGIYLATDSARVNVTSNTVYANGNTAHGIVLSGANGNNVSRNSITVGDTSQYGLQLIQSVGNNVNSNTINSTSDWAYIDDTSSANFTNTTFQSRYGNINLSNSSFAFGSEYDINRSNLGISANRAFINTSNLTPLNTSGVITLYGISYIDPKAQVDWSDNGTYVDCPANVCTKPDYTGANLIFNVSHFTSFGSAENATQITGCPVAVNDSAVLSIDIESNTSCIEINNDNITLDCNGHQIRYNAMGGNGDYGIYAAFRNNVTIENCFVLDINQSGGSTQGIQFNAVNSSVLNNNTVIVNGTNNNVGLRFNDVYYNIIENTTVITNCSGSTDHGIMLSAGTDNQFSYNTINAEGLGGSTYALLLQFGAINNTFINNVFQTGGVTGSNVGILMGYSASDNTFTGNTIKTYGASGNFGFYSLLSNLTHFSHNNFTTTGSGSYGLIFLYSSGSAADTTLLNTTAWMYSDENSYNYLGATTFQMPYGSINIPSTLTLAGFNDIWYDNLNIQYNRAYMNSSNLSFMNTSGIVTLYGITYASPQPSVDWNDDGVFEHCNYDICTPISFAGNDFVFSTAHFTSFAAAGDDVIINSTINQSNITNCTIINSTVINSTKSNCTIINSIIINSTNDNTTIIDSNETNSYDNDTIVFNSTIRDSIKDNSTIIGSNITNSTLNNSVLENCTVTNSTLRFGIIDSNCNYINYNQSQPVPPVPPGGQQGGGGGGYGGGGGVHWKRSPNITSQFRNPPCVENWNCEAWSRCVDNSQTRICVDLNSCSKQNFMPKTEQQCAPEISIQQLIEEPPAEPQIPMTMPDLRPEQEQPILPPQTSAALSILPILLDVSLIILALLTIIAMLLGSEKRSSPILRIFTGIMMAASLAMMVWHYVANSELLPMQVVVFILLAVSVTLMWLYDYFSAESRKVPEVEFESTAPVLPDGVERIEERPVTPKPAIPRPIISPRMPEMRAEEPKQWVPRKIYVLEPVEEKPKERIVREKPAKKQKPAPKPRVAPVHEPEEPEGPMDLDSVLRRSKITLQKLDKTLKKFKKSSKKKR